MNTKETFKGFIFFWKGMQAAKREMWVSVQVLLILTLVLALILYFVEHAAQPENYSNIWDSMVWGVMSYLGNPGKFSPGEPVTLVGRYISIIISIIKILIFAIPAGLVANGFRAAMSEDKQNAKLAKFRKRMRKAFRKSADKTLREYLNTLPEKGGKRLSKLNFVPSRCSVAKLQVRQGMSFQDIIDTVNKFPEFRLKTLASAVSDEDEQTDTFVVEQAPINRPYGCCINRGSRVTIVSTSGFDEVGTSWFSYYLAKFGGFNYISKEIEVDSDELDSFYNMSDEPLMDKLPLSHYLSNPKKYQNEIDVLNHKQNNRDAFLSDLECLAKSSENPWIIVMTEHIKNSANTVDFHFSNNNKSGDNPTIIDGELYNTLFESMSLTMQDEFNFECVQTSRYPHLKNNLLYKLKKIESFPIFNGFVFRPSSHIMTKDARRLTIAFRIAQVISNVLTSESPTILDKELQDFEPGFGYAEQDVENQNIFIMDK